MVEECHQGGRKNNRRWMLVSQIEPEEQMAAEKSEINVSKFIKSSLHNARRLSLIAFAKSEPPRKPLVRLVGKDGTSQVEHEYPTNGSGKFSRSTFPILLEVPWRWIFLVSCLCFLATWAGFALIYYAIAIQNGDFRRPSIMSPTEEETNVTASEVDSSAEQSTGPPPLPIAAAVAAATQSQKDPSSYCVTNVKGYIDMFLFSVESQQTIGYGFRYPTDACPPLITILSFQYVIGVIMQGCICGLVCSKLVRPTRLKQEIVFSDHATISTLIGGGGGSSANHRLAFTFRISSLAGHLVHACVRLYMAEKRRVRDEKTGLEELFSFRLVPLRVGETDGGGNNDGVLLLWPSLITHVIDESSPLYEYGRSELEKSDLEIIAVCEALVETTGLTVQARTSYLPEEILWGQRFEPMNFLEHRKGEVKVHYAEFDHTRHVNNTPNNATMYLRKIREEN